MINIVHKFFSNWWWSFLMVIISTILLILVAGGEDEISYSSNLLHSFAVVLFAISFLLLIISTSVFLIRRKWVFITVIILIAISGFFFINYYIMKEITQMFGADKFTSTWKVPLDININIPKGERFGEGFVGVDSINNVSDIDFELYNTELPGIYDFVIWTNKIESGTVYLKAYEITNDYPLSPDRLQDNTKIKVFNPKESINQFGPSTFIISEGDWDKFYAARFELWFKPNLGDKRERKLIEKIYKIEGYSN
jgi:hypothetical protein